MAAKDQGADRTEPPTPKRLRDARKEGQVHKSKEITSTLLLLVMLGLVGLAAGVFALRAAALTTAVLDRVADPFAAVWGELLLAAAALVLGVSAIVLLVPAALGALVEYLQVGPVFALKRVLPKLSHVNPVEGLKRVFSMDNLVALLMAGLKAALVVTIAVVVVHGLLPDFLRLPNARPDALAALWWEGLRTMAAWVVVVFVFVAAFDAWYQRHSYMKQLRMSRRDIRQEHKDTEGDPMIRGKRRELHQEWARQNAFAAVREASVVVTNPTHYAVALRYVPGETPLPTVVAKGEDFEAREIRRVAEEAGVPVMEHVELARGLHAEVDVEQYVPSKFFEAVAQVLRWADEARAARDRSA